MVAAKADEAKQVAEVAARPEAKAKTAAISVESPAAITLMAAIAASPKRALPMVAPPRLGSQPVLARPSTEAAVIRGWPSRKGACLWDSPRQPLLCRILFLEPLPSCCGS